MVLDKKQMSEEDIKLQYITPAITSKWNIHKITMETQITDGKVNLKGNIVFREKPKRADYVLYLSANNPIAIVEAKDNNHSVSFGLQQAMDYARMLDLPFAYSSNGDAFMEHDFLTGTEREFGLDEFPTEDELIARYKAERNGGHPDANGYRRQFKGCKFAGSEERLRRAHSAKLRRERAPSGQRFGAGQCGQGQGVQ